MRDAMMSILTREREMMKAQIRRTTENVRAMLADASDDEI